MLQTHGQMNSQSLKYAEYWRNSLADGALGTGIFRPQDTERLWRPLEELTRGQLAQGFVNRLFEDKPKSVHSVQVIIRPKVAVGSVEHAAQVYGLPKIIAPVATRASVTRERAALSQLYGNCPRYLGAPGARFIRDRRG